MKAFIYYGIGIVVVFMGVLFWFIKIKMHYQQKKKQLEENLKLSEKFNRCIEYQLDSIILE